MILIALALLCVAAVPLTGGRLGRLADIRLRGLWIPVVALAVQVVITTLAPHGNLTLHRGVHVVTYLMLVAFVWANRSLPWMWLLGLGTVSNATAIIANLGVMPASVTAERIAGLRLSHQFHNSAPLVHPHLLVLGDIFPWPGPLPNVLSVGDLLIFTGAALLLHRCCARPAAELLPLEPEADAHLDLEVRDLIALDVPADRPHLDPVELTQGARRTGDA